MQLIFLGYCANLAYVIHGNEDSVEFATKLCHFGMVCFGIMLRISKATDQKKFFKVKREH